MEAIEDKNMKNNISETVVDATMEILQPPHSLGGSDLTVKPLSGSPRSPVTKPTPPRLDTSDPPANCQTELLQDPGSAASSTSDRKLGHMSSGPDDRVFPIRSVVSVDPGMTPLLTPRRISGELEEFPGLLGGLQGLDNSGTISARQPAKVQPNFDLDNAHTSRGTRRSIDAQTGTEEGIGGAKESQASNADNRRERRYSTSTASGRSSIYGGGSRMQIFRDASSEVSTQKGAGANVPSSNATEVPKIGFENPNVLDKDNIGNHVTARFEHVITKDGHAIITGRDGDVIQRCEDEPIHIPGAVQSFGLLIALSEGTDGQLMVRIVSENSKRIIGLEPAELFKLESFTDLFSDEQAENLLDHIDFIRDEDTDPATNGPEVFIITLRIGKRKHVKLWCAMHMNPAHPDLIICEFELDDDQLNPLSPASDERPESPEDTLHSMPTEQEFHESTKNSSRPLRVLRSARKRKGEAAAMEVFNIMSQVQEQLASAPNLEQFLKVLVGVVKELTGFHRVMIYQFDASFNGRVVTELVDPRATKDLYKGLNFPASDIPKQARDLYKINKVRLLYDRDLETARLVCRTVKDLEKPLDLSFSYLRAMSPIHIKYLANMAVRSSMSISINAFNELWGLIACHSYGAKGMRVSFPIRKMCRLVGDTASRNIERLSYASRLQARKLINTVPTETNPSGYIVASSDDLLTLFDADFGLLSIRGETKILGKIDRSQEALAMLEYLRLRCITSVVTSQDIRQDFPDLRYPPGFDVIAGLLLVPLSAGGQDFIVFFRRGQIKEVKWAGNPYEKSIKKGTEAYLEPRKSFKQWSETVVGKCRDWTEEQIETAAVLCLVYGKFIEVWRQKEAAVQSSQLTRLLLANSAHEVRTPLNAIINYLEIALEGTLDPETRESLAKSHSASKSLIYVINDLLDLTKAEAGQELIKYEVFDLPGTIKEATDTFKGDAMRKDIDYKVIGHPEIPKHVYGDQRRIRQVLSNLTANAMQNTTSGWIHVHSHLVERGERQALIEFVIEDSGAGMSSQKLDALFRDLEQVSTADDEDLFPNQERSPNAIPADGTERRPLGLGLAIVGRIVGAMNGQLRLKSEEGKGSRFVVQLPFEVSEDENPGSTGASIDNIVVGSSFRSSHKSSAPIGEGEVMLINKVNSEKFESLIRKRSVEDMNSFKSGSSNKSKASAKSDVDRLIDAISEPHMIAMPETEEIRLQRSNSKGSANSRRSAGTMGTNRTVNIGVIQDEGPERPGILARSRSYGGEVVPEHRRSLVEGSVGSEFVTDNKTPLKAVRIPEEFQDTVPEKSQNVSHVLFDLADRPTHTKTKTANFLEVLVAEDDPINSRIIKKRLEKSGHTIHTTVNGEECFGAYKEKPKHFDVILMDMQMPIVDGLSSTKMIRSYEQSHPQGILSSRAELNGRVPIFAVSASLVERECQTYIDAGFDGWILKPIDFKRLGILLSGIVNKDVKTECLYKVGEWERGGWLHQRHFADPVAKSRTWPYLSSIPSRSYEGDEESLESDNTSRSDDLASIPEERNPPAHNDGHHTDEKKVDVR